VGGSGGKKPVIDAHIVDDVRDEFLSKECYKNRVDIVREKPQDLN